MIFFFFFFLKNGMRETKGYTTNGTLLSISLASGFSDTNHTSSYLRQ